MSSADPSPAEGKAMTAEEAKRPLDEQLLRALSNNTYGTIAPWVLQDALAHLGRWRNRAFIAEEAADQFRADLDAERAAHQAAEARVRVLESALRSARDKIADAPHYNPAGAWHESAIRIIDAALSPQEEGND